MQKILQNIQESEAHVKTADHLIYSSFPLLKEKRILIKAIHEINSAIKKTINSILQYEFSSKRIKIYTDPKKNFKTFVKQCSESYKITKDELKKIVKISAISRAQKDSPMEFLKNQKVVIFSTKMDPKQIEIEEIKDFLLVAKSILKKTKEKTKMTFTI